MTAIVSIDIMCDSCGRKLPTIRTKVACARGDAERAGWRASETGDGYRRAGLSEDRNRRDECPWCRTDRPKPDAKPDGALTTSPGISPSCAAVATCEKMGA